MNVIGVNNAPLSIFPHMYKIMIIGRCGVGKTSLLWRYLYNEFKEDLRGTIIDKETKKVNVNGKDLELELWDTASNKYYVIIIIVVVYVGLETYCTLSPQYLRDANAVIILYDITDPPSYIEVKESWIGLVCAQFGEDADQRIPILLVGSKSDLIDKYDEMQIRVRRKDVIEDMKQRHSHILGPIECSAKSGKNVEKVFKVLGEEIVRRDLEPTVINKKSHVSSTQNTDCKC